LAGALIKRGSIVMVAVPGTCGKPRPALAVQSDLFAELPSIVVCPLTSLVRDDADQFRLTVHPEPANGLSEISQIAVDKVTTVPRERIRESIGQIDDALLLRVNRALALFLGIA
jgi:mRNA interferase MazF